LRTPLDLDKPSHAHDYQIKEPISWSKVVCQKKSMLESLVPQASGSDLVTT